MADQLSRARNVLQETSDVADDRDVRERLRSLDEGLMELTGGEKTQEQEVPHDDRLREVEKELGRLEEETDGAVRSRIQEARNLVDAYRQVNTIERPESDADAAEE